MVRRYTACAGRPSSSMPGLELVPCHAMMPSRPCFDTWALSRLWLYKHFKHRGASTPHARHVFDEHLASGFPRLRYAAQDADVDSNTNSELDFRRMDNNNPRHDDYQQLMNCGRDGGEVATLLGSRELDLVHRTISGQLLAQVRLRRLLRWLALAAGNESAQRHPATCTLLLPLHSLSATQCKAV
jgi:hypothetical protein